MAGSSIAPPVDGPASDYHLIRETIAFLTDRRLEQPDLAALASHLEVSETHCQRVFKRWCGLSPKAFLQALTIDHARRLLDGSSSLLETSLEVGLSGPGRLHDLFVDHEAMTPGDYKRRGAGLAIDYGFHPSPFGTAVVLATDRGVCGIAFADGDTPDECEAALHDLTRRWPAATYTEAPDRTAPLAAEIFGDPTPGRERRVRLVLIGTDFEVRVWESLLRIPMGRAVTYGDIAEHLGQPTASRAVGSAVGRNPISFVVPCHRVMRRDGGLGGYHWGVTRKRALIGWEKGQLANEA